LARRLLNKNLVADDFSQGRLPGELAHDGFIKLL